MPQATRRLTSILSADVAGYSRLMGDDEPGTMAALAECQSVFRRLCDATNGRIVDTAGDSVLGVFDSVADALLCARTVIISGDGPLRFNEALPSSAFSYPARAALPEDRTPARGFLTATELEVIERNNLVGVMEATGWKVSGTDGAAAQLGLPVSRLKSRLKALRVVKPDSASLYVRFGGGRGVETFARDLFSRAIAHPTLGRFWKGRSTYGVLREERLLIAYLSSVMGGPIRYVGRDMRMAHRGLGITAADWEVFRAILSETLAALRIQEPERHEVVDFAESLRADIVQG